ncbi:hypothetical protein F5Y19DRAFT_447475 [Xylariaceae sp. FL1651]|nr:hypothetical protein F5Y19DRAFT_447475 [Xylariaceae sp. FL1651]
MVRQLMPPSLDRRRPRQVLKLSNLDTETIYISTLQIKTYFDLLQIICQVYTLSASYAAAFL